MRRLGIELKQKRTKNWVESVDERHAQLLNPNDADVNAQQSIGSRHQVNADASRACANTSFSASDLHSADGTFPNIVWQFGVRYYALG